MRLTLLSAVLVLAGCESGHFGTARIDPALAALVPADTIILAGFRMAEIRTTALYTKLAEQQRLSQLDDFAKRTNFDPRTDLKEMLVAFDGIHTILLARGDFKLQAPPGLKKSTYKGTIVYGEGQETFAILDGGIAVAGAEPSVRSTIDLKQTGRTGPSAVLDRARALPSTGQIWLVANGWGTLAESALKQPGDLSNLGRVLQSLEGATATVDLRAGIAADVRGSCRTDQDAKTLGDAIRGMVGIGRLSVPENQPEMLRLFDGIKVEQQQRSIQLTVQIPPDLIDRLLKTTDPRGSGARK